MARTAIITAKVEPAVKEELMQGALSRGIPLSQHVAEVLDMALDLCRTLDPPKSKD